MNVDQAARARLAPAADPELDAAIRQVRCDLDPAYARRVLRELGPQSPEAEAAYWRGRYRQETWGKPRTLAGRSSMVRATSKAARKLERGY